MALPSLPSPERQSLFTSQQLVAARPRGGSLGCLASLNDAPRDPARKTQAVPSAQRGGEPSHRARVLRPLRLGVLEETHRCLQCPLSSYCEGLEHHRSPTFSSPPVDSQGRLLLGASEGPLALARREQACWGSLLNGVWGRASLPGTPGERF